MQVVYTLDATHTSCSSLLYTECVCECEGGSMSVGVWECEDGVCECGSVRWECGSVRVWECEVGV